MTTLLAEPLCDVCDHSRYGHVELHANHPYTPRHTHDAECWCRPTLLHTTPLGSVYAHHRPNADRADECSAVYSALRPIASLDPRGMGARTGPTSTQPSPARPHL